MNTLVPIHAPALGLADNKEESPVLSNSAAADDPP